MRNADTKSSTSSSVAAKTTRQFWRRTAVPRPWWPWGLLPIFGLVALFLFGALITAPAIQAEVREGVAQRLDAAGVTASEIAVDGRQITARIGATATDDEYLRAIAATTTCDTWAGSLTCPASVTIERVAAEAAPAISRSRPHQFEILRDADAITLRGEVPSVVEHERIISLAGRYFGQVDDQMNISNEAAGANYAPATDHALVAVSHLVSGKASWSGTRLSVSGTAHADDIATARAAFDSVEATGMLGQFDVRPIEQGEVGQPACNEAFDDVLSAATIRFRTNSATIDAGNDELLERLAEIAKSCPGRLTIEGHTDSRGDADMNKALSLARAAAVRDALAARGVANERMHALGYGEANPIADNASAAGRAKNRRIAISVADSN